MLALRLPSFNDRPSGRPRPSAAAVLVCRHGPLPAREGRKTPSSASKAGEWRRRERLVTMDARSGPVGEGPVYCFQCHQGHCRRSLLGHRDSRARRGTSDGGPSRSRATEGALQEPGSYRDRALQYVLHADRTFSFGNGAKIGDGCKNFTVQYTRDNKGPLNEKFSVQKN